MTPFHPSSKTNASTPLDDLLVVTGPGDGDPDNKLLTFLVKKSGLTNSAYGDGTISVDPNEIKEIISDRLDKHGHIVFFGHGIFHKGQHYLHVKNQGGVSPTRDFLNTTAIGRTDTAPQRRETWHLLTCEAGHLRKEINPGSPEWKQRTIFIYSSSKSVLTENLTDSVETMLTYLSDCKQKQIEADPLQLFIHLTKTQGDCVTVLGGDLHAPLVSHAPKTHHDQNSKSLGHRLEGDPRDLNLLKAQKKAMGHQAKQTENEARAQLRIMLFSRVDRLDMTSTTAILAHRPALIHSSSNGNGGHTLLTTAAIRGSKKMIQLLLNHGAELGTRDDAGNNALFHAIFSRKFSAVACLIDAGAKLSDTDSDGDQALAIAAAIGCPKMVRLILKQTNGSAIDARNNAGETALIHAAKEGRFFSARLLLKAGADYRIKNVEKKTAQQIARDKGHPKIATLISKHQYRQRRQATTATASTASSTTASSTTTSTKITKSQ
jgi:ankyrin repeat protein